MVQMASSSIIDGGLEAWRVIRFGSLEFLTDDSAWHPDDPLSEITLPAIGSLHFRVNGEGTLCLQDPIQYRLACQALQRRLRRYSKPRLGHPASRLAGKVNSDSMYPLLESVFDGDESSGSRATEVFMANTPPPHDDDATHNAVAGNGGAGNDAGAVARAAEARAT